MRNPFRRIPCWLGFHDYMYINVPGRVMPLYQCSACGWSPYQPEN